MQGKGKIFGYSAIIIVLITMLSLLQKIDVGRIDLLYYCATAGALVIGIIHVIALNKLIGASRQSLRTGTRITVMIVLISAGIIISIYQMAGLNIQFVTFIIPFIVAFFAWNAFLHLKAMQQ